MTHVEGRVIGPGGEAVVLFLVDSGATYSVLPKDVWQAIDLRPVRELHFSLADGTVIERNVSECRISLPDGAAHSPVVLGEAEDEALLGILTLENMGLILNPFTRKLQPMRLLLA